MPTDDERRDVARRMREIRPCKSGHIEWWKIAQALDLKEPAGWFGWEKFEPDSAKRLADLVEPSGHECVPGECPLNVRRDSDRIDRDALIVLARNLDLLALMVNSHELTNTGQIAGACQNIANGIREALGMQE